MKIDPLKCSSRCLKCTGGNADAVYGCTDAYCPQNGMRVSDHRLREENPPITEATGRWEPLQTPVATDGGLRDFISVTITND